MSQFPTFQRIGQRLSTRSFWLKLASRVAGIVVFLAIVGLASNAVSRSGCEADTRRAMLDEFGHGTAVTQLVWLSPATLRNAAPELRKDTAPLTLAARARQFFRDRVYFPQASVAGVWAFTRPHVLDCPFLVRVYYGHGGHSGCGKSAVREYLSLFGHKVLVADYYFFIT